MLVPAAWQKEIDANGPKAERYRRALAKAESVSKPVIPPLATSYGNALAAIIARESGHHIECGDCKAEVLRLNQMTAHQIHLERDAIASAIVERGKTKALRWWQRWGATLAPEIAKRTVLSWIDEATGYPWRSEIRHLTMHIWPTKKHDAWKWNLTELSKRWNLFNGKRIIAIAYDGLTVSAETVLAFARSLGMEFDHIIVQPNHRSLREVATWLPMLELLSPSTAAENEVVFSMHGKGVRHETSGDHIQWWAELMYRSCLDNWPQVEEVLKDHVSAGSFKRYNDFKGRAGGTDNHCWHYSGTFFWWRLSEIGRRAWKTVDQKYYGTESWLGYTVKPEEAACLFHDNSQSLYEADYWRDVVIPEWQAMHTDTMRFE